MFGQKGLKAKRREQESKKKEAARLATYKAPPATASLIIQLGQERLKALQAGATALDARTTQVAGYQLAAAGFCAGLAATQPDLTSALLASAGCLSFVLGSALAFFGVHACDTQAAGIEPSYWERVLSTRPFNDRIGRSWIAHSTEACILDAQRVDAARARWLNISLMFGAIGAFAVLCAVGVGVWTKAGSHPNAPRPIASANVGLTKKPPSATNSALASPPRRLPASHPAKATN
jgi:hypothetical protein